jgi:Uma2 family endonuclease
MATVATKKVWTDEELMRIKHEGKVELVDGEVKLMTPAGAEQGNINANLTVRLGSYILRRKLGYIFDAQTGFRPHQNMRAPIFPLSAKSVCRASHPKDFCG